MEFILLNRGIFDMICEKCREGIYLQAMSKGKCIKCGKTTLTPHLPSYIICKSCSEKLNLCEQCGKELQFTFKNFHK